MSFGKIEKSGFFGSLAKYRGIVSAIIATDLPLTRMPPKNFLVILNRSPAGNTQTHPMLVLQLFPDVHDLPDVVGVVRELALDGFHDGVRLVSDRDCFHQVVMRKRDQSGKQNLPACLPTGDQVLFRSEAAFKFLVFSPSFFTSKNLSVVHERNSCAHSIRFTPFFIHLILHENGYTLFESLAFSAKIRNTVC